MPTEIPEDNESRSDLTMSIYDVITIPEEVQELVWKAASSLGDKIEVETGREGWELCEYEVTEECKDLAVAINNTKVCTRKPNVATFTNCIKGRRRSS